MHIDQLSTKTSPGFVELHGKVRLDTHWVWGDEPFNLWYQYPADLACYVTPENGDPFLAALLIPAMLLHENLTIEAPVSPMLLNQGRTSLQDVLCQFDGRARRIDIRAPARTEASVLSRNNGLFFSMGVDSSYTLLKNLRKHPEDNLGISHLITVQGFDVYLWERERFLPMLQEIKAVGGATSKQVLPVTTNLRELSDRVADWPRLYHGAALASVALALGRCMRTVRISASSTYDQLFPWGTHPVLDPLWSTERTSFVHDGCEARRIDKIGFIARSEADFILSHLRVCTSDEFAYYNCGACEKCLRTMIGLHIHGALQRCTVLPGTIDPQKVSAIKIEGPYLNMVYSELKEALGDSSEDRVLRSAILKALEHAAP